MARQRLFALLVVGGVALTGIHLLTAAVASASVVGCVTNPGKCITGAVGGVVGGLASDAITSLAQAVMKWVVSLVQELATVWVGITPPSLTDSSTGQATGTVAWLASNLAPLTAALAMVSILLGSIKIAVEERPSAHLRQLVKYVFTFVLVSGSAAAFVGMAILASDDLATSMIHNAIGQETFANKIGTLLGVTLQGAPPVGFAATLGIAFATIVLGILACLAMIAQVMIMLLRGAMLIALVGTLPAAAAASNTEIGMMWFKKQIAWVVAWAAYPLAAAVIYSAAFLLPGQGGLDALLSGVLLLIAAVVALPVLIRFLVPMTSTVSGGSGVGQIAAEGAAAAMLMRGLPTGAAQVNEDAAGTETDGGGDGSADAPSGATADGGDDGPAGGSAAHNGATGAGAGATEGAGAGAAADGGGGAAGGGAGAAGVATGAGVAVRMGMDGARSVGETAADGIDDGSPGGGGGATGGANGSRGATGANGSYPTGDSPAADSGTATGAAASAGYSESSSDGGSGGGGDSSDGGGMSGGPGGSGGAAGPSGA